MTSFITKTAASLAETLVVRRELQKAAFGMSDIQGMGHQAVDYLKDPNHEWALGGLAGAGIGGLAGAASSMAREPEDRHTMRSALSGAVGGGALGAGAGILHQQMTAPDNGLQPKIDAESSYIDPKKTMLGEHPIVKVLSGANHPVVRTGVGGVAGSVPGALSRGAVRKAKDFEKTVSPKEISEAGARSQQASSLDKRLSGLEETMGGTHSYETAAQAPPAAGANPASASILADAEKTLHYRAGLDKLKRLGMGDQMKTLWNSRPEWMGNGENAMSELTNPEIRGVFYRGMPGVGTAIGAGAGLAEPYLLDNWLKKQPTY